MSSLGETACGRVQGIARHLSWNQAGQDATRAAEVTAKPRPAGVADWKGPRIKRALWVSAGAVGGAATGAVLVGPVLGLTGFSTVGPVAGSIAAALQSAGVVGWLFSSVQSAAMGGYGVPAVTALFAGTGAAGGAAVGLATNPNKGDQKRQ